jgi:hypothetical protein
MKWTFKEVLIKTKLLCSNRGISLIGEKDSSGKFLFFQKGYGEFRTSIYNVWGGTNHPLKAKEQRINTCFLKYGTKNNFLSKDKNGKLKRIKTNLDKYGYENNSQHPQIIKQIQKNQKKTMKKRYGVEYAAQSPKLFKKIFLKSQKLKSFYSFRFGNLLYQGSYELKFIKKCENDPLIKYLYRGDAIWYINPLDNKRHKYFIDFKIIDIYGNIKLIEIKSQYTFGDNSNKIQQNKKIITLAKIKYATKYAKKINATFECILYDRKKLLWEILQNEN